MSKTTLREEVFRLDSGGRTVPAMAAQGVRRISRDTIAAGVIGVMGALIGVAFGQWLEDWRRRRGELHREVRAWSGGAAGTISESRVFELRFFNESDVNISLWDAEVECYREDEMIGSMIPQPPGHRGEEVGPLDLESRKSVYVAMEIEAEGQMLEALKRSDRMEFVATKIPGGDKVRESLPTWSPMF